MRVSREQAEQNRERVLDTAARLFRERGFGGVGVAELMKSAGLTHGGFYGQFESKDDLMAQACRRGFEEANAHWKKAAARAPDRPLDALVSAYLSTAHRDAPGEGCVAAALGPEAARSGPAVRHVLTEGMKAQLDVLTELVPGETKAARRQRAAALFAGMVGALVLSRVVDDEALSKQFLKAVKNEA